MSNDEAFLMTLFARRGYVRLPNAERRARQNQGYHKGYEVRLRARSRRELRVIREALRAAGFKPGKAYQHGNGYRQPVYGKELLTRWAGLIARWNQERSSPARLFTG